MKKLVLGVCLLVWAFLLVACSQGKLDSEYIDLAADYSSKGEFNSAIIELKNALQKNPENAEARYFLGKIYLDLNELDDAIKELEQALSLRVSQPVAPLLARTLLLKQSHEEVIKLKTGELLSAEDQLTTDVSKGLAYLGLGYTKKATEIIEQAFNSNAKSTYVLMGLAQLRLAEGDVDSARDAINAIFDLDDSNAQAWALLGGIEQGTGNLVQAEKAFTKAIQLKTGNAITEFLSRIMVRLASDQVELAENDLNALPSEFKDHPHVNYAKGIIHMKRKEHELAQSYFEKVLNTTGDYLPALYYSAGSHFNLGNKILAEEQLNRYVSKNPANSDANRMLATIMLQRGDYEGAEELLDKAVKLDAEDETLLLLLSESLMSQGKTNDSVEILKTLVNKSQGSAPNWLSLAKGMIALDNNEEAINALQKALALQPNFAQAYSHLVYIYQKQDLPDKALETAKEFVTASDSSGNSLNLLATVYMGQGDDEMAKETFGKVLDVVSTDYSANSGMAVLAVKVGDFKAAHSYYGKILSAKPDDLATLMNVADLYMAKKESSKAREVIEKAVESNPGEIKPRIRLGWFFAQSGEHEKTPELLADFREIYPNHIPLLILLADSAYNLKQYSKAEGLLKQAAELDSGNAGIVYSLAKTKRELGDVEGYMGLLKDVLLLKPDYVQARIELANNLVVQKQLKEAQKHVNFLNERFKNTAEVLLLEGKIAELKGDFLSAVESYQPIYDHTKNNVNLIRVLRARWLAGQKEEVISAYKSWLAEHPGDVAIQFELASSFLEQGDDAEAIEGFRQVLKTAPDNVIALNNLSWLLKDKDNSSAKKYAEQAYKLQPEMPEIMDTLALVLIKAGKAEDLTRAERLLEKVLKVAQGNLSYRYHKLLLDIAGGETLSARDGLKSLLAEQGDFSERDEAEALLQTL